MAVGSLRCIVIDVNDLRQAELFWGAATDLPLAFSGIDYGISFSRLGEADQESILLQLVPEQKQAAKNRAHPDITVADVDHAIAEVVGLGGTLRQGTDIYPPGDPVLEWAVMADPFGNEFCLVKDL